MKKIKKNKKSPISFIKALLGKKGAARALGLNLIITTTLLSSMATTSSAFSEQPEAEIAVLAATDIPVATQKAVRPPTETGQLTQGYNFFHRALDFKGKTGDPVFPVMDGRIEEIHSGRLGYGNYIVVNHGSGLKSLYAHLSRILVHKNEEVDKNTVIGLVGAVGWVTGPHLHFEMRDSEGSINLAPLLK